MTATSMISCVNAPAIGGKKSDAAIPIASADMPIPAMMLCRAMPCVRFAIATASDTRSSRSTRITTSAASDDALAPRAPIATPTSAAAKRGRIIDAVTDHDCGVSALLRRHGVDLVGRLAVGKNSVEIERRPDRLGGVGAISGHHHNPRHAGCSKRLHSVRRFAAEFVGKQKAPIVRPSTATNTLSAERHDARRKARAAHFSGLAAPYTN